MSDVDPTYPRAEATAIHEAGHAVARWRLGGALKTITVIEDDESWGRVTHHPPGDWFRPDVEMSTRVRQRIEIEIITSLAGAETETVWLERRVEGPLPDSWVDQVTEGGTGDFQQVARLALYATGSPGETDAYIEWLRQRTLGLMTEHYWCAVEELAAAVTVSGRLPWIKARDIMRNAYLPPRLVTSGPFAGMTA